MNEREFQTRTKTFGLRIIRAFRAMPKNYESHMMGRQLIRCGTSVGSNYRAACRAKSRADIIAKLKVVEEESDESAFWVEMLVESECVPARKMSALLKEANEITAMVVASIKTVRKSNNSKRPTSPQS